MRTENDLRAAFELLEERADEYGTPDFLTAKDQRARSGWHGRTVVTMLAAAAAVTAVAVAVPRLAGHDSAVRAPAGSGSGSGSGSPTSVGRHPSPSPSSASTTVSPPSVLPSSSAPAMTPSAVPAPTSFDSRAYFFTVGPINGFSQSGGTLFTNVQQRRLDVADGSGHYDVTLNAAGAWTPVREADARTVHVGSRPGFYGTLRNLQLSTEGPNDPVGLAWQYDASGAWASVVSADGSPIPLNRAVLVADAVRVGQVEPVTVPVRIGALPAGLALQGITGGPGGRSGQHGYSGFSSSIDFARPGHGTELTVAVSALIPPKTGTRTTVNGREAYVADGGVAIYGDGFTAEVNVVPSQPSEGLTVTREQLLAIARSLRFAPDIANAGTWFDAAQALPQ